MTKIRETSHHRNDEFPSGGRVDVAANERANGDVSGRAFFSDAAD